MFESTMQFKIPSAGETVPETPVTLTLERGQSNYPVLKANGVVVLAIFPRGVIHPWWHTYESKEIEKLAAMGFKTNGERVLTSDQA